MSAQLRCPYCRSIVSSHDPELARCLRCNTAHHKICAAAHGECTLFGCACRNMIVQGQRVHVDELAKALSLGVLPFRIEDGLADHEPRFLRFEGSELQAREQFDDERAQLKLKLSSPQGTRGQRLKGQILLDTQHRLWIQQLKLALLSTVETKHDASEHRQAVSRKTKVIDRSVVLVGQRQLSAGSKLMDGLARLLKRPGSRLLEIEAGRHVFPFSFELAPDFPATVEHRRGGEVDVIRTELSAQVFIPFNKALTASRSLVII